MFRGYYSIVDKLIRTTTLPCGLLQMPMSGQWLDHIGRRANLLLSVGCVIYSITSGDNRRWRYVSWFQDRVYCWRTALLLRGRHVSRSLARLLSASFCLFPFWDDSRRPSVPFRCGAESVSQSGNQSKHTYTAPYVASESEARTSRGCAFVLTRVSCNAKGFTFKAIVSSMIGYLAYVDSFCCYL